MKYRLASICRLFVVIAAAGLSQAQAKDRNLNILVFKGMADASGAVDLGNGLFAVADDELNPFQIYRYDTPGMPVQTQDFSQLLNLEIKSPEADWEAATRMGDRTYWISSHGQNYRSMDRPNRHQFFAADIRWKDGKVALIPVGKAYHHLVEDLIAAPQLKVFEMAKASRKAPKTAGALNIEGLTATGDNKLLLGFRNPVPKGKALLVPINNPDAIFAGKTAELGDPILLDLGGLGIRDITFMGAYYYIAAGSYDGESDFKIYRWLGPGYKPMPVAWKRPADFTPEGLVYYVEHDVPKLFVISDDGNRFLHGKPMKSLPAQDRSFRALSIELK